MTGEYKYELHDAQAAKATIRIMYKAVATALLAGGMAALVTKAVVHSDAFTFAIVGTTVGEIVGLGVGAFCLLREMRNDQRPKFDEHNLG